MLVQQVGILGNIPVIEIGNPEIKQYVKKKGEIEDGEIKAEIFSAHNILHGSVDAENPEGFYQQVKE
jgi:hypothetical protein